MSLPRRVIHSTAFVLLILATAAATGNARPRPEADNRAQGTPTDAASWFRAGQEALQHGDLAKAEDAFHQVLAPRGAIRPGWGVQCSDSCDCQDEPKCRQFS